ncbi:hypothetical protein Pse7367_1623 [Thalassoporum mexicanum PCC 7367]|uniref:hypothetical protein n=1 Tax=Thalassoporum mexicanum TaxID=3457544 RepID=UPI00029FAF59|nr:hypothetical protein [Pseudanabaena sp. PCC 7367]AFY69911.1 hypothetical protein Pse7367_1623 [Pseudanabaena sp. PCC 7367]
MKRLTKKCSLCNYYESNGRNIGYCRLLDAPVQGNLEVCSRANIGFKPEQCLILKKPGQQDSYLKISSNGDRVTYSPDNHCQGEIMGSIADFQVQVMEET